MLKELRTFLAVGRHGTFSSAGQHTGLTQSAVSAQIQRLEEQLGFQLFDRVGRSARLNAAGRETLARAEQLLLQFERLHLPAEPENQALRLGAIVSVQTAALPAALATLLDQHPTLRLRVVPGVSLNLLSQVDAGELDTAIVIRPPFALPRELVWHGVWTQPFVLIVHEGVRGRDWAAILRREPFLRYDRNSFGGRLVARFLERQGLAVRDRVEMDEIAALVQLVAHGKGVALIPRCAPYFPLPAGVRAVALGAEAPKREVGVVERRRHPDAPVVAELRQALRRYG